VIDLTQPVVINLALTGMVPRKKDNPAVPVTPAEVVADAVKCYAAGARIFHIHARREDEEPTYERALYAEMTRGIRAAIPGAVICVTTSGRVYKEFEYRSDSLKLEGELKADLASLTLGSLNFPKQASVNEPAMIQRLAQEMNERGIVPELEVFDFGMIDYAQYLIGRKILREPFVFNLLLGSLGTSSATGVNLATMVERSCWWSAWRPSTAMASPGLVRKTPRRIARSSQNRAEYEPTRLRMMARRSGRWMGVRPGGSWPSRCESCSASSRAARDRRRDARFAMASGRDARSTAAAAISSATVWSSARLGEVSAPTA